MIPKSLRAATDRVRVVGLKVDFLDRPLGVENTRPQLSWRLESDARQVRQSAYRIWVASSEALLATGQADLWDSGRVTSRCSFGIRYAGKTLGSRQPCWWRVQIWDERKAASSLSAPSTWEMGLLKPADWSARWLAVETQTMRADREAGFEWIWSGNAGDTRPRQFRRTFSLDQPSSGGEFFVVVKGTLRGVWLNGHRLEAADRSDESGQWIRLSALPAGEHVLAVEVESAQRFLDSSFPVDAPALAFFARLDFGKANAVRLQSNSTWRTTVVETESGWQTKEFRDDSWEEPRPTSLQSGQPWPALPALHLRRTFEVDKPLKQARLYVTALGAYEARINGARVGDALLTPEPSQYARRVLYRTYDVTSMLSRGANAVGITVGDGWYASFDGRFGWAPPPRRVLAQLELTFADGTRELIGTGPGWRTAESPIRTSEIGPGEVYDARLEQPGWDRPSFDDSNWEPAGLASIPTCRVTSQVTPPIRVTERLKPQAISQPRPGVYVFDFGQCFAGWCRLQVKGDAGTGVELRFAELLMDSGEVDPKFNLGLGDPKRDVYILKGNPAGETFEPHFTYRGFRYVQITGLPAPPTRDSLEGLVVHSDLRITGNLRIDSPLIQQLWRNTLWTQRSNFVGIPTDCPSRERSGYMGDAGIFWDAAAFNMDVCAFTARQMDNVRDDQSTDGVLPEETPQADSIRTKVLNDGASPAWALGGVILPWTAWRHYGDLSIIERNWDAMDRYLDFILAHNPDYLWKYKRGPNWGDWLAAGEKNGYYDPAAVPNTPKELIATAYWAYSTQLMSQMADAIGRERDAVRLRSLFEQIRTAFNQTYVAADGTVGNGSQGSHILALKFGLLPPSSRKPAAERLVADLRSRGGALTTGIVTTQFVLDVLAEAGFDALIYDLLLREENPSWGYMIRHGATTVWEEWSGSMDLRGKPVKMSQNHYAFGAVCGFLFRRVAGIDTLSPGFESIVVRPVLDPRVPKGGGDYDSIMGRISTDWTQHLDGRFMLDVTLPANTTARVHLPVRLSSRIEEGGRDLSRRPEIRLMTRTSHEAILEVGSGTYKFAVAAPPVT